MTKVFLNVVVLLVSSLLQIGVSASDGCQASDELDYVCGLQNAEDLVVVPGTSWVLSSGMAPGGGIYLVDPAQKTWSQMYTGNTSQVRHDKTTYTACHGAPLLENLVTHGLNIRPAGDGHATLYVVGHGAREAIEVFDVDASGAIPALTWVGCVPMPDGAPANSVVSLSDGSLRATVLMHSGFTFSDVFFSKPTGAVYAWSPGGRGFELMHGTELPGNNGIEISSDEEEMIVVSTGLSSITVFSNSNPARLLRSTGGLDFGPDNIHMTTDGLLITAGPSHTDHNCGALDTENMDLEAFASCPKGSVAATYDTNTLVETKRWSASANPHFGNATMALQVGEEVWIGSFSGQRIGVLRR